MSQLGLNVEQFAQSKKTLFFRVVVFEAAYSLQEPPSNVQAPPFLKKMGDSFKSKGGPGKVLFDAVSKGATKDGVIAALEDCETPEDLAYTNSEGCAPPRVCAILRAPSPTLPLSVAAGTRC